MRVGGTGPWSLLPPLLAALLLSACAAAPKKSVDPAATLALPGGEFRFEHSARDAPAADMVRRAVSNAAPRLARWGTFQEPVTLVIHPNHAALERAAHRDGYDFLRAWARFEQVEVQSPRTWTRAGATQKQVDEVLLHELTHSLMWQASATVSDWTKKGIPLWFSEGMASYTAGQGYRVPSLEDLSRFLHQFPQEDPLARAESLYETQNATVYGAAHHAFTFLVERYGEARVRGVLAAMRRGQDFTGGFGEAIGLPVDAFLRDFRRYVFLRGFKGGRLTPPRPVPRPEGRGFPGNPKLPPSSTPHSPTSAPPETTPEAPGPTS
ncbi:hypothetical protein D7X55_07545 [Corallococcus sp. AB049A]|uniref:Peptidase MA-like domain-containing protein n=1 Tax=Corallococcus interemptor TaxID=2316720 RepID=A0A3A8QYF1_9BACT|nr:MULTISPECIES: hypothetical protein [Corallococcus]RKH53227.1 hypothetical protein D7Y23_03890 [Corallococcus sp. AB050B]RKH73799.1 hypothetical protein D7X96_01325 [Corallococcus interemptor]RKI72460.1 hypothetical protein D7X55_07545 [Corallococcus sp. AB049A]